MSILLGAHDVKRCARRIHNEWDPSLETEPWEPPAAVQMLFDQGVTFHYKICEELNRVCPDAIDLSDIGTKHQIVGATVEAMAAQFPLIMNGWLPDDPIGGRKGRPDLLVHVGDGRYLPGEVKNHLVTCANTKGELTYSLPGAPGKPLVEEGRAPRERLDDALQLAHYWRMLQGLGRSPDGTAMGIVIGTERVLTWIDLDLPRFTTFSRSQGKAKRTALQRYDHEFTFRRKVATAAANREPALVEPVFIGECDSCSWYDYCRTVADDDIASAHITKGRLSVREWQALKACGVTTVDHLAALDVADEGFREHYLPEVAHLRDAIRRLELAVRRARMVRDGLTLQRITSGPITVPSADIEIDFDIEWDSHQNVYLWGCLITRDGVSRYRPIVTWDEESPAAEFAAWLRSEIAAARELGRSVLVFHYSPAERNQLCRLLDDVDDLLEHFVDLMPIVKGNYFGLHGLGIKQVAPAFGFHWRDEDPGGLQSQVWLQDARAGSREARQRILDYNEDDVRATAALRDGLRQQR